MNNTLTCIDEVERLLTDAKGEGQAVDQKTSKQVVEIVRCIRVYAKYMCLDIEATVRERDDLVAMLGRNNNEEDDQSASAG